MRTYRCDQCGRKAHDPDLSGERETCPTCVPIMASRGGHIETPKPNSLWAHHKDPSSRYVVIAIARLEIDHTIHVVYKSQSEDIWVRPLSEFIGFTELGSPRFHEVPRD